MSRRQTILKVVLAGLVALALPVQSWAGTMNISGTIEAVDATAGTIVLGEIGPWRVKGGVTEVTSRSIVVSATAQFALVKRAPGAGATGWIGDYIETALGAGDLRKGDFVIVKVQTEGDRLVASKVTVVAPDKP